jgi:hypothetical protein
MLISCIRNFDGNQYYFSKKQILMGSVLGDGRILFDTCGYSLIFFGEVNFSDFLVEK